MELTIERLSKRYEQHWALHQLSLRCGPGLVSLVGPNGAGKTSLVDPSLEEAYLLAMGKQAIRI